MMENKDWTGDRTSIFATLGASNHSDEVRAEDDYYATEPKATEWLCRIESLSHKIWEPAVGGGHMAEVLKSYGHDVKCTDIRDRGYEGTEIQDFFDCYDTWDGDIVTNPPYSMAKEFVEKALALVPDGHKVCMFLKLQFLEGKARKEFYEDNPPLRVWVSSSRLRCARNGVSFEKAAGNAVCYAWFVWSKGFKGATEVRWFN